MKHIKKFNENMYDDMRRKFNESNSDIELQVSGQKRYRPIKYGYKDNGLFISSSGKVISFETSDNGVDISDISKIEDIINFLMDKKDKLM